MPHNPPRPIRVLPERIVNRIAAGEVIERPAAAVKELVENALDAGATRIAVALDGGGIDRIEVADDGSGMDADALALAVQRHATSKLADDDLVRIATLGFRGEALPSIGAAARACDHLPRHTTPTARTRSASRAAPSRPSAPAAGAPGTRVVVRDLFFATPARRKFLKHPRTEAEHAEAAVRRLAMTAPGVAFRLESDGRTLFDLPRQDRAARVAALLGPDAAAVLLPVRRRTRRAADRGLRRLAGGHPRHQRRAGPDRERPPGVRSGAEDRGARGLPRRHRRRALPGRRAVSGPAGRGTRRQRASPPRPSCGFATPARCGRW